MAQSSAFRRMLALRTYNEFLPTAIEAAKGAASIVNRLRFSASAAEKADGSIVTNADTEAETFLRDFFSRETPNVAVWGEECGRDRPGADIEWIVDPIDGTTWYEMGSPIFGTLIGLAAEGEPVLGVICLPATGEMVSAAIGHGCFYSNPLVPSPVRVHASAPVRSLSAARVSASGLHRTDIWLEKGLKPYALSKLPDATRLFRLAGDSVQHALVARGKLDAAIDTSMHPWDNAAIIPCILEAGGVVCGIDGQVDAVLTCGSLLSASSPALLEDLVTTLAPTSADQNLIPPSDHTGAGS